MPTKKEPKQPKQPEQPVEEKQAKKPVKKSAKKQVKKTTEKPVEKSEEKEPAKFKFECTKCGACCQNRSSIPITFTDLARWTKQGSFIQIILPHLELESISEADELSKIAIIPFIKMKDVDATGKGTCPFFDVDNKICNIYFTLPVFCKTFPLAYNGQKFYVSDSTCEGLGKASMTKEALLAMRQTAISDYSQRAETSLSMVPLQGMFIRHFMKQSQDTVNRLSDEDQKKLDELISKSKEETNEPEKPTES